MTVRQRLLFIVLSALTVALALSTVGFNLIFARANDKSADALLRSRARAEAEVIAVDARGHATRPANVDVRLPDGLVWIFTPQGLIEHPRTRAADAAARTASTGNARYTQAPQKDIRLYTQPVYREGRRVATVVVGVSLAPYEAATRNAVLGSALLALVMIALAGVAVWWLIRSTLRPVAQMTEQADLWSERDLDRRFELGEPHDELTQLGATLDGLLDRIAASLRHERRFSAELSHELKTPLARVIAEAEVTLLRDREPAEYREALERTLKSARQLQRIVETLVAVAQHEAGLERGTADAYTVACEASEAVSALADERNVELVAEQPELPVRLGVDGLLAERVLQPVLENACRYGRSSARLRIVRQGSKVLFLVDDDGPGVPPGEQEAIFEPGVRGSAAPEGGAGLGLALARRLARTASGDVVVGETNGGGHFVVTLPSA